MSKRHSIKSLFASCNSVIHNSVIFNEDNILTLQRRRGLNSTYVLYVPPVSTYKKYAFSPPKLFMYFIYLSEQIATSALYNLFMTEISSDYCAVRTGSLNKRNYVSSLKSECWAKSCNISKQTY
jgi:hypothetical protein